MNPRAARAGVFAVLVAGLAAVATAAPARPNVLFISADDFRFELGAHGSPWVQTPNLDRLAAQGTILLQAHCQYPQCAPSRSSLFAGRRPDSLGVYDVFTRLRDRRPDVVTLPQLFKQHGYKALALGKVYHSSLDDPDAWSAPYWQPALPALAYVSPETTARITRKREAAAAVPGLSERERAQAAYGPPYEGEDSPDSAHHDGMVADKAIEVLRAQASAGSPFFLAVGFRKPHLPFVAPKKYWDLYDPTKIPLAPNPGAPAGAPVYGPVDGGEVRAYEGMPKWPAPIPDAEARKLKHAYFACISFMDAQVGRVLAELERLGLADNTLVVFWSDHGFHLGEQSHWGKWSPYEWDSRAPVILRGPGVPRGVATSALVEFVDLYPTVAELAAVPPPAGLEGTSFVPLLAAPDRPWKDAVFTQVLRQRPEGDLMAESMRTPRYRVTRWSDASDRSQVRAIELYDRQVDPAEMRNVADEPGYAGARRELLARLAAGWRHALPAARK